MKHLLIVGARGWGREVYAALKNTDPYINGEIDVKGFLDSKSVLFDGLKCDYPSIICSPEDYEIQEDDVFFIAMGEPQWRKHYAEVIEQKGGTFISIICKSAAITPTATIGVGSFVSGWSCISDNVVLGKHSIVHVFSDLGHDAKVGDFSTVEAYCFMGGYSQLGNESMLHVRSQILPHKIVGNNTVVGSNSVVMNNVKDGLHVFGNPARKIDF